MKKKLLYHSIGLPVLLVPFFVCCSDKEVDDKGSESPKPVVELSLERSMVSLVPGSSVTIKITGGNGEYRVNSSSPNVVKASVSNDELMLTAGQVTDKAEALVVVVDKMYQRATIDVDVANEFEMSLNRDEVDLVVGMKGKEEVPILIESGNFGYSLQLLGQAASIIEIDDTNLETAGKFVVKALKAGTGEVKVTDHKGKEAVVRVTVTNPPALTLDKSSIKIDVVQGTAYLNVANGNGGYHVLFEDPMIAKVRYTTEGGLIAITGKRRGVTTATVEDRTGLVSSSFTVEVDGPQYAMMLGEDYYGYASFSDLEQVDPSMARNRQITLEMSCYMTGYRGGQTFMGLSNNLLLQGLNDDYRPTHPISIVGNGLEIESSISFTLHEWMHIALVVDAEKQDVKEKYQLYINGVKDENMNYKNVSRVHNEINLASSDDANKFVVGWATDQYWCRMLGAVSEVRVWKSARTPQQIMDNMWELKETGSGDLFARWDFSAGVATDYIQDTGNSGHEINLTLSEVKHGDKHYRPIVVPENTFMPTGD